MVTRLSAFTLKTGIQVRAGRALLRWEQSDLAKAADVSVPTVHRLESLGLERCSLRTIVKIEQAFEKAGIVFHESEDCISVLKKGTR